MSNGADTSGKSVSLPMKVVVSLRAGFVLALANIVCILIFSVAWMHVHAEPKSISVTGSAKKQLESDLIVWKATVSTVSPDLVSAYGQLQTSMDKVRSFLHDAGITPVQTTISSIETTKRHAKDNQGHDTEKVVEYELSQSVEITSNEITKVSDAASAVTSLIKDGVLVDSESPRFIYTKLADLKIEMLADATKDAQARAQQIAVNSGAKLGTIIDARMGVMQINPVNSNSVSDSGNNDTTSRVKEITAVVTARFALKGD
jgi:uncharacterized protein